MPKKAAAEVMTIEPEEGEEEELPVGHLKPRVETVGKGVSVTDPAYMRGGGGTVGDPVAAIPLGLLPTIRTVHASSAPLGQPGP